jgi:hypothetical protein
MVEDKNSLLFWFPRIKDLGIPYPKTEIVLFSENGSEYIQYIETSNFLPSKFLEELIDKAKLIGYPLFMRTDYISCKHSFHNYWIPYIKNVYDLARVSNFFEESINCGFGLPLHAFVLREFLELDYRFKAFSGMPIARERRYFIRDGAVVCHHAYWPEEAIRFFSEVEEPQGWQSQLQELNIESQEEVDLLTEYATKVANALEGYWSVDFAYGKNGIWYLIDMATGEESWHPDCEFKLTDDPQGS